MSQTPPVITEASGGACPVSREFDPFNAVYLQNPYPFLSGLREIGPVVYSPKQDAFLVTRYDDVIEIMNNRTVFTSANTQTPVTPLCEEAQAILDAGFPRSPTFTNADGARHAKMRAAGSRVLTPRRWRKSQPEIAEYAEGLVQKMAQKPVVDIMTDLTYPLPAFAAFRLLGYPLEDIDMIKGWCGGRVQLMYGFQTAQQQVEAAHALKAFWAYCRDFVNARNKQPADDLVSDWLALVDESDDKTITIDDVVNMTFSVSLASHETSTNAILNGVKTLMENRSAWEEICQDPSLIPNAVEELLRFSPPTMVIRRLCTEDYTIQNITIPKGATVMCMTASANHDDNYFDDAGKLDIHRSDANKHLAFGHKWHFCLGSPLARFEYSLVLTLLTKYMPDMTMVEGQPFAYLPNLLIRGVDHVLVNTKG